MTEKNYDKEISAIQALSFKELLKLAGMTKAELSRITKHYPATITNWGANPPESIRFALACYIVGRNYYINNKSC